VEKASVVPVGNVDETLLASVAKECRWQLLEAQTAHRDVLKGLVSDAGIAYE